MGSGARCDPCSAIIFDEMIDAMRPALKRSQQAQAIAAMKLVVGVAVPKAKKPRHGVLSWPEALQGHRWMREFVRGYMEGDSPARK